MNENTTNLLKAKEYLAQQTMQEPNLVNNKSINAMDLAQECYNATAANGAPLSANKEFDHTTLDALDDFIKTDKESLIARSQGGMFNKNDNTSKSATLVLNQYEKSYYKTESLMSKIGFSRTYNGNLEFVELFKNEFVSHMGEGYSVGQEKTVQEFYNQEYEILSKIQHTEISSVSKSIDLKHYNSSKVLEAHKKDQVMRIEEEFIRTLEYNAFLTPTMRSITTMNGNQQGIQSFPNTIHPIIAKNSDGFNVIMLNSHSGYEDGLFNLKEHYNNPFNRGVKTRYATEISVPADFNQSTGRADIDTLRQLLNIARGFSNKEHIELGNSKKGFAGRFGGKPIFVCTYKLYNSIVNQSRFQGTGANSNEFSDNIERLKEVCDIEPMTMIGKTDGYNTGDLLGFFIYPKSYFVGNITRDETIALQYNKLAWKETDAIMGEYYQNTEYNKIGQGVITLTRTWSGFSLLPNPFSALTVLKK